MRLAIIALLSASAMFSADLSGIWVGLIPRPNLNPPIEVAFQFVQTGSVLRGKLYGDYNSTPISEGKVEGDNVSIVVIASEQAGNQINETRLTFTGTLKEDGELELTRERGPSRNAGNKGDSQTRPNNPNNAKQTFKMKRLL